MTTQAMTELLGLLTFGASDVLHNYTYNDEGSIIINDSLPVTIRSQLIKMWCSSICKLLWVGEVKDIIIFYTLEWLGPPIDHKFGDHLLMSVARDTSFIIPYLSYVVIDFLLEESNLIEH